MASVRSDVLVMANPGSAAAVQPLAAALGFRCTAFTRTSDVLALLRSAAGRQCACVVLALGRTDEDSCWPILAELQAHPLHAQIFAIILSRTASQSVTTRMRCFDAGAKMLTRSIDHVGLALRKVAFCVTSGGKFACPMCGLPDLTEEALRMHMFLHHEAEPNPRGLDCPICGQGGGINLPVHLHNDHGDLATREPPRAPYSAFAWTVCRRRSDGKFLLVNEPAGISGGRPGYWLPAGRVDVGESLVEAAERECLEEAGVACKVIGVVRFMVDNMRRPRVMRVALMAEPLNEDDEPKSVPDFESCGALWVAAEDLASLSEEDFRSLDPAELYPAIATGELPVCPINTEAFQGLEATLRKLTRGERSARAELSHVWEELTKVYPASSFRGRG